MNANPSDLPAYEAIDGAVSCDMPSVDAAWSILDAANDLGDVQTVEACRRIIDASLRGALALQGDMQIVINYFR
jgi:hypothetical protein